MVFVWRGFGIVVPIVLLISGWITSYWFEDTKLGNSSYLGWTMLWAGIVLILAAIAALGGNSDEEGNPVEESKKSVHSFFWLPIWVWCIVFIGLGTYFIFQGGPTSDSSDEASTEEIETFKPETVEVVLEDRALYFYNCAADSIQIEIVDPENEVVYDFYVLSSDYSYADVTPDDYTVNMDGSPYEIELVPSTKRNEGYNDAWMILCGGVDFVLVEVTNICKADMNEKDINDVDWMGNVVDRFSGDDLIEPQLYSDNGGEIKVVAPNVYLPQELEKNQSVYVLIPIDSDEEVSEQFLDEEMVYLSVRQ